MICKKCGKEISMDSKFCSYCGTENEVQVNAQTDSIFTNDEKKAPKGQMLKKILVMILAMALGTGVAKYIIVPAVLSNSDDETLQTESTNKYEFEIIPNDAVSMLNPEYIEIIEKSGIADIDNNFQEFKSNIYLAQLDGGSYEKIEFGYDNDIVKEVVSSLYYPISNYTEIDIETVDAAMKQQFSSVEQLSFCQVAYSKTDRYYCVTIKIKKLDSYENVKDLSTTGILGLETGVGLISMELTEEELLNTGYVKKYIK